MHAARIDHLVIAARTLDEGVRWCEATLGVAPDAPLVGCQAFLSRPGAMPRTVTAGDLGVWAPSAD